MPKCVNNKSSVIPLQKAFFTTIPEISLVFSCEFNPTSDGLGSIIFMSKSFKNPKPECPPIAIITCVNKYSHSLFFVETDEIAPGLTDAGEEFFLLITLKPLSIFSTRTTSSFAKFTFFQSLKLK